MNNYLLLLSKYRDNIMGIAIIWIMMFHLSFRPNMPIVNDIMDIGYGGVDLFLFLSGFGLYFSLSKKNTDLAQYYKKRFCRILPEFWLFLIVTYVVSMNFDIHSFWNLICQATTIGYWVPNVPYTLWYISCILFFYAIFPVYFKLFKKYGFKIPILIETAGFILIIIYAWAMIFYFNNTNKGGTLILTIARIPIFFIGAIAGYWVKNAIDIKITHKKIAFALLIFTGSIISLEYFLHFCRDYLWTCSLYFLPFIIIAPILSIIIAIVMDKIPKSISSLFAKIGSISLELYIVHEYLYQKLIHNLTNEFGTYISIFTVTALSFILAIILYKINKILLQRIFKKVLNL